MVSSVQSYYTALKVLASNLSLHMQESDVISPVKNTRPCFSSDGSERELSKVTQKWRI